MSGNPVSVARNAILLRLQEKGFEDCLYLDDSLRLQGERNCFAECFKGAGGWKKRDLMLELLKAGDLLAGVNNVLQTFRARGQGRLVDDVEVNLLELRK